MGAPRGGGRRQRPGEGPGRGRSMERGWRGAEEPRGLSRPDSAATGLPRSVRRRSPGGAVGLAPPQPATLRREKLSERARRPSTASSSLRPPRPARVRAVNSAPRLEPARHRPAPSPSPASSSAVRLAVRLQSIISSARRRAQRGAGRDLPRGS